MLFPLVIYGNSHHHRLDVLNIFQNDMENHVVSLELAKQLKNAGVPQVSEFYWVIIDILDDKWSVVPKVNIDNWPMERIESYSAFLSGELGEMLPEIIKIGGMPRFLYSSKFDNGWAVQYWRGTDPILKEYEESEADARGLMLLYLLKNNLIKILDIKE